jgi:hypothetical protein
MSDKTVVLHIGTHKTGTKSLQGMFDANSAWFGDQGLYYPVTGRLNDGGHHNIAWQLFGDPRFDPTKGSLNDLLGELDRRKPPNVFLSSEDFESLYRRTRQLEMFRSALEEFDYRVEVVVVLRDPTDYVPSLYEQLLKHGFEQTLDQFVDGILTNGGVMFRNWDLRINYEQLAAGFADVFGAESVHALRYEEKDSVNVVLDAASAILGLSIAPVAMSTRHNARLDERTGSRSVANQLSSSQAKAIETAFGSLLNDIVQRYPVRYEMSVADGRN